MPIHDWTRVSAGTFHSFHNSWIAEILKSLNDGLLPAGYYAMSEQQGNIVHVDVLTLRDASKRANHDNGASFSGSGGIAVAEAPPKVAFTEQASEMAWTAMKRRTVTIRQSSDDRIVALLEIVSPGNKDRALSVQQFVSKVWSAIREGNHVLVVDLIPPDRWGPAGMQVAIWAEFSDAAYEPPAGEPLATVAYESGEGVTAYVQPLAVGDPLPEMPLFLEPGLYVNVPLEATYAEAYRGVAERWRRIIEGRD